MKKTELKGKADSTTGRIKKIAGAATSNKKLARQGSVQDAKGKVKQAAARTTEKVKRAVGR